MRTIAPIFIVLAIGISGAMLTASGFEDAWGAPAPSTDAAQEEVSNSSQSGPQNGPVSGPVSSGDSSIIGLLADSLGTLVSFAGAVLLLPLTLINIGFPAWFVNGIGSVATGVVGIGLIQFAVNRVWK